MPMNRLMRGLLSLLFFTLFMLTSCGPKTVETIAPRADTISGTVWYDNGDGTRIDVELKAEGVSVELWSIAEGRKSELLASVLTSDKGAYQFIIPADRSDQQFLIHVDRPEDSRFTIQDWQDDDVDSDVDEVSGEVIVNLGDEGLNAVDAGIVLDEVTQVTPTPKAQQTDTPAPTATTQPPSPTATGTATATSTATTTATSTPMVIPELEIEESVFAYDCLTGDIEADPDFTVHSILARFEAESEELVFDFGIVGDVPAEFIITASFTGDGLNTYDADPTSVIDPIFTYSTLARFMNNEVVQTADAVADDGLYVTNSYTVAELTDGSGVVTATLRVQSRFIHPGTEYFRADISDGSTCVLNGDIQDNNGWLPDRGSITWSGGDTFVFSIVENPQPICNQLQRACLLIDTSAKMPYEYDAIKGDVTFEDNAASTFVGVGEVAPAERVAQFAEVGWQISEGTPLTIGNIEGAVYDLASADIVRGYLFLAPVPEGTLEIQLFNHASESAEPFEPFFFMMLNYPRYPLQ